jgi:hypothetical protein
VLFLLEVLINGGEDTRDNNGVDAQLFDLLALLYDFSFNNGSFFGAIDMET